MSKAVKDMVSGYLRDRYDGVDSACVIDISGLDVEATQAIRESVRESSGRIEVVKNSLARRAFVDTPLAPLGEVLKGPSLSLIHI